MIEQQVADERASTEQEMAELLAPQPTGTPRHAAEPGDDGGTALFRRWFRRGHGSHCAEHVAAH